MRVGIYTYVGLHLISTLNILNEQGTEIDGNTFCFLCVIAFTIDSMIVNL